MLQWIIKNKKIVLKNALIISVLFGAVFCIVFVSVNPVYAQGVGEDIQQNLDQFGQPLGLANTDIRIIIARIIRVALGLVGIVLVSYILYAGFLWMTSGGNETQIDTAKKMIVNAVVGLAIILSAFGIVTYIISSLTSAINADYISGQSSVPQTQNFIGSGALGKSIKDHYPMRDQKDVPRNSKIIVTFRKPIKPESFITDTTGDGVFGNCRASIADWRTDCDQLIIDSEHFNISRIRITADGQKIYESIQETPQNLSGGASALVSMVDGKVFTVVVRPNTVLGDSAEKVGYLVHLGNSIKLDDPANGDPGAFDVRILGNDYYEWEFTCNTTLDTSPPKVTSVYPSPSLTVAKNSVIQINFSEPMDPIGIQGQFRISDNDYVLDGNNLYLRSPQSTVPVGDFSLTNEYRTLEFTSSKECGTNACGNKIYCLPVCDRVGANCIEDVYSIVLKSAELNTNNSFEAVPFSGFMDSSGNALDGNRNNLVESAPTDLPVFDNNHWLVPDNYFWSFTVRDQIDATAPYIIKIVPGINAEFVSADQEWSIIFSKKMRVESLYNIDLQESDEGDVPLWKVPRATDSQQDTTLVRMEHGPFLQADGKMYFPIITSAVEDVNYNCFYPGRGPKDDLQNTGVVESAECEANGTNCCGVAPDPVYQAFCCNGLVDTLQSGTNHTVDGCVNSLNP